MTTEDQDYEDHVVTELHKLDDGSYSVSAGSTGFGIPMTNVPIAVGSTVRTYGQFGRPIRGIAVDGVTVYYRTPDRDKWYQREQRIALSIERTEEWLATREALENRRKALPESLQRRLRRFRALGEMEWCISHEAYETFCLEQAVQIVSELGTLEELEAFRKLDYDAQVARVSLDKGHSGNTFGFACLMADALLRAGDVGVQEIHGALCPLVGCEDYHCYPHEQELWPSNAGE
jgi:hypothetical protein